jgi:hypothetical protein
VGTDLLQAAITKAGGTYVHAKQRRVDWRITMLLAAGSLPAAVATLWMLHEKTVGLNGSRFITTTLGIALLLTALALLLHSRIHRLSRAHRSDTDHHPAFTVLTGIALGFLVSISSVGAGALGVTALFFLYPRLRAARVVASDLAHAVPLTLVAGLGHWLFGSVDWSLLGSLLVGSLPGIYLGSQLVGRIPDKVLRGLLAIVLVLVGIKLITFRT